MDRTVLAHRARSGPLAVQRPFYPEQDVCHLYILHPPGGVVGGDQLDISAVCRRGSAALITTPGATKFYRSTEATALQTQRLRVDDGASLEWLPQENIFFPGANARLHTEIHLEGEARFIGWDLQCFGRPAIKQAFAVGDADFSIRLWRDSDPLLLERFAVHAGDQLSATTGLRGWPILGTLIAVGADHSVLHAARSAVAAAGDELLGITLIDDVLVARYLGANAESARNALIAVWKSVRHALINRAPCAPRIWAT